MANDDEEQRINVRQAVNEYVKLKHPDWKIESLALNMLVDNSRYEVAADIFAGDQWRFVQFQVWFMVKDNGETYWKVSETP